MKLLQGRVLLVPEIAWRLSASATSWRVLKWTIELIVEPNPELVPLLDAAVEGALRFLLHRMKWFAKTGEYLCAS